VKNTTHNIFLKSANDADSCFLEKILTSFRLFGSRRDLVHQAHARVVTDRQTADARAGWDNFSGLSRLNISQARNFIRWPVLGVYVWPNPDGFEDRTTYASEVEYLKRWIEDRLRWMDGQ
jgi:hypothetical protein